MTKPIISEDNPDRLASLAHIAVKAASKLRTHYEKELNTSSTESIEENCSFSSHVVQWASSDGLTFIPAFASVKKLPPGYYSCHDSSSGPCVQKINVKTESLVKFPDSDVDRVVSDIQNFWEKEERYCHYGVTYKRGIILYGPPGSGKSSAIQLLIKDIVKRNGIALQFDNCSIFKAIYRAVKRIQPETPVVVILEDIDSILRQNSESEVINLLDGIEQVFKTVFIATTNYPEELGERIVNRPSRFDLRIKVGLPNDECRRFYLEHLFRNHDEEVNVDIDKWVSDTDEFTISHIKALFTAVIILQNDYETTLSEIKQMISESLSSKDDKPQRSFGFASGANGSKKAYVSPKLDIGVLPA